MTWEYLAGLFDGEGNIQTKSGSGAIIWSVSQSRTRGKTVMQEIQHFLRERGYSAQVVTTNYTCRGEARHMYLCRSSQRTTVKEICRALLPFARIKKVEVQDAWRYLVLYPAWGTKRI